MKDDGGPVYPNEVHSEWKKKQGKTLRDDFASKVNIPWDAAYHTLEKEFGREPTGKEIAEFRADYKYIEADAMIAEKRRTE